jgi:hypothetical protein
MGLATVEHGPADLEAAQPTKDVQPECQNRGSNPLLAIMPLPADSG